MGLFTGIWGALKTGSKLLLGADTSNGQDRVMEVAKGVGSWIDEQQFTEQEKAEKMAEVSASLIQFVASTKDENTNRSITRRNIAIWVVRVELITLFGSGIVFPFDKEWSEYLFKLAGFDTPMGWAAMTVLVFFFGNYALRIIQGRS